MDKFYYANTEEKFKKVIDMLFNDGYEWVGIDKNPTFAKCKKQIHGNGKLIINAFYNDFTNKKEIQFGTKSIYNSYPQYKGKLKIMEVL